MSRFETSRFVKNPQVMNQQILKIACDKLGWKYEIRANEFLITEISPKINLHGEFALKVVGDQVVYNSYSLVSTKN